MTRGANFLLRGNVFNKGSKGECGWKIIKLFTGPLEEIWGGAAEVKNILDNLRYLYGYEFDLTSSGFQFILSLSKQNIKLISIKYLYKILYLYKYKIFKYTTQ